MAETYFPEWAIKGKEPPQEVMEELVCVLYGLRVSNGLEEVPYWVPFDTEERKDWVNYTPFAWNHTVSLLISVTFLYVRRARENHIYNKKYAERRDGLKKRISKELDDIRYKACQLCYALERSHYLTRCDLEDFMKRTPYTSQEAKPEQKLEDFLKFIVKSIDYYKPVRGNTSRGDEKFIRSCINILRGHIERVPTQNEIDSLLDILLKDSRPKKRKPVIASANRQLRATEFIRWFEQQGINPRELTDKAARREALDKAVRAVCRLDGERKKALRPPAEDIKRMYDAIWPE